MKNSVEVIDLHKVYGRKGVAALRGVSISVPPGELLVLLGPSGCGKTTLLRSIAGLESPTSGRIVLGDEVIFDASASVDKRPNKRDIGLVFQNFALWPHMTVAQNVAFPLEAKKQADRARRVTETLASVRCEELRDRLPGQLSGGQQQRVALARALVSQPGVVLFDEPLSNLDARLRVDLRRELRRLHRELGFTGVYVTHDLSEAMELGDTVAVMSSGTIEQVAAPTELHARPASAYVAEFLGVPNRWEVTARGDGTLQVDGADVRGAAEDLRRALGGGTGDLFVRAEDLVLVPAEEPEAHGDGRVWVGEATVADRLFQGTVCEYVVQAGPRLLSAVGPATAPPIATGALVRVGFAADAGLLFPTAASDAEPGDGPPAPSRSLPQRTVSI